MTAHELPYQGRGWPGLGAVFTGPGGWSFDALLGRSTSGAWWDVAASLVGLLVGGIDLAQRHTESVSQPAPPA